MGLTLSISVGGWALEREAKALQGGEKGASDLDRICPGAAQPPKALEKLRWEHTHTHRYGHEHRHTQIYTCVYLQNVLVPCSLFSETYFGLGWDTTLTFLGDRQEPSCHKEETKSRGEGKWTSPYSASEHLPMKPCGPAPRMVIQAEKPQKSQLRQPSV